MFCAGIVHVLLHGPRSLLSDIGLRLPPGASYIYPHLSRSPMFQFLFFLSDFLLYHMTPCLVAQLPSRFSPAQVLVLFFVRLRVRRDLSSYTRRSLSPKRPDWTGSPSGFEEKSKTSIRQRDGFELKHGQTGSGKRRKEEYAKQRVQREEQGRGVI